jgi:hypothetical protein
MRLADIPTRLIEGTLRKWRRRAIAVAVIGACALVAAIEALAAARLALEFVLGPVGARLVLASVFVAIVAATALLLRRIEAQAQRRPDERSFSQEERAALIAEAIDLGYTMARDLKKPSPDSAAASPPPDNRPARPRNGAPAEHQAADG